MTETESFEVKLQSYYAAVAKVNAVNKAVVFDALSAAGITHVAVGFDGEGDSGQIDGVCAHAGDTATEFPPTIVTLQRTQFGSDEITPHDLLLREAVEELCYGYLEQEHGGWENNDGAYGEFTFDVTGRRIELDFNARFSDSVCYSHSF